MSQDFKTFLIILILSPFALFFIVYKMGEHKRATAAEEAKEQAAYQALSPEQKLRQEIDGITELNYGETQEGIEALQLTITQKFPSSYSWFLMTIEDHTRAAYASYPQLQLLDIKINLTGNDTYGQPQELPGLLYEMDRQTFQKIQWDSFNLDNLPKIATRWTPLHHQLKP